MFQALTNDVLQPFLRQFVLVSFDDILTYSTSWSTHLWHLRAILDILHNHQLFQKRSECSFGEPTVSYLAHVILATGVVMDNKKVRVVMDWLTPSMTWVLHGFLGIAGYYRKFIKAYSSTTVPLTNLLKKDGFTWSPAVETTFDTLKIALTTVPMLQLLDLSVCFIVECDALGMRLGVVLHQGHSAIAFFSRPFAPHHCSLAAYMRH